jgi:hypothetical protein
MWEIRAIIYVNGRQVDTAIANDASFDIALRRCNIEVEAKMRSMIETEKWNAEVKIIVEKF